MRANGTRNALLLRRMTLLALAIGCLLVVLASPSASGQSTGERELDRDPSGAPYVSGELLVSYEKELERAPAARVARSAEASVQEELPAVDAQVLEFPGIKSEQDRAERENRLEDAKRDLENAPSVKSVDYNYIRKAAAATNDPLSKRQWHLGKVGASRAWDRTSGSGVSIAVLDTGIDLDHPDLRGKIDQTTNVAEEGRTVNDTNGHGTHVAGIAAADTDNGKGVAGVCRDCDLDVAKITSGRSETTFSSDLIAGINWAASKTDASVINISFAGEGDPITAEQDAIDDAWSKGVTIVASAGNFDSNAKSYPAAYDHVLAVAATTKQDARAGYSNYGQWVDISAPGGGLPARESGVYSTLPGGYGYESGTSMSSPVVAGVAGLLAGQDLPNEEVVQRLEGTSVDLGSKGRDPYFGYGRVDAAAAVGARPRNTPPRISNPRPKPGARVGANRMTLSANVLDDERRLARKNITLTVDGKKRGFDYSPKTGRLKQSLKLGAGRHRVHIVARDGWGLRYVKTWRFTVSGKTRENNKSSTTRQTNSRNINIESHNRNVSIRRS